MNNFALPIVPANSILGLNYSGMHDTTVVVVSETGELVFACALERLTRVKQDGRPPVQLLNALPLERFTKVAISTNAHMLSEGETYSSIHPVRLPAPRSAHLTHGSQFQEFLESIPLTKEYVDHHMCHAHSAFWLSGFSSALCLTYDGGMCNSPWFGGIYAASQEKGISPVDLFSAAHHAKVTSLYSFVTALLGFTPNKHEGKITGLAAYGKPRPHCRAILDELFTKDFLMAEEIAEWIFTYSVDIAPVLAVNEAKRRELLKRFSGISREDIAATVQNLAEEHILDILRNAREQGIRSENICLAGGLFANVKINQRVKEFGFQKVFVVPPMTDDGTALGAALFAASQNPKFGAKRVSHVFLGPSYDESEILKAIEEYSIHYEKVANPAEFLAKKLCEGATVGVFQGAMEFGPRALGNRSILSQATRPEINAELNARLNRTEFMPFAPMTRLEDLEVCYNGLKGAEHTSEFMTITSLCTDSMRSQSPAVVHVDGTARPQIVRREQHPFIHQVITRYKELTGIPSIINTSFNIHEEPIVCSPSDAIEGFLESGIDFLYFEGGIVLDAAANQGAALDLLRNKRRRPSQKELKLWALTNEYVIRLQKAFADLDQKESELKMQEKVLMERDVSLSLKEAEIVSKEAEIRMQVKSLMERGEAIETIGAEAERRLVEMREKDTMIASVHAVAVEREAVIFKINDELESIKRHWAYRLAARIKRIIGR